MKKIFTLSFLLMLVCNAVNAAVYVPVFQETFANCHSVIIQGGYFSENFYFQPTEHPDNAGWTSANAYESERAIKFSAKTKTGTATSPAINFSQPVAENVKVRFRAETWRGDNVDVHVEFVGVDGAAQVVDTDVVHCITDRNEAPIELTFSNIPSGSQLKFSATAKAGGNGVTRFFLSDIVVYEDVAEYAETILVPSTFYHHFNDIFVGEESQNKEVTAELNIDGATATWALPENTEFALTQNGNKVGIQFVPRTAGSKEEVLTVSYGGKTQNVILTGIARVYNPECAEASDVTDNGFTAHWVAQPGIESYELQVYAKEEGDLVATNLFFSKYIEGKSNNRALEIYNGTGHSVDLLGYKLRMESNGAGGLTASTYELPDMVLADGATFTIANAQFAAVRDIATKTIGFQDGGYDNIMTFTGDDAIALFDSNDEIIDLLGYESTDALSLLNRDWGMDVSLYRKSYVYEPTRKFYINEWDKYAMDYCDEFGTHVMERTGLKRRAVETVTLPAGTDSYTVANLSGDGQYFYRVKGVSNGIETPYSAEVAVSVGTNGVQSAEVAADAARIYNAQGIYVGTSKAALPHGLYIIGGRKVIL